MRIAIIATLVLSTWSLVGIASADAPRKPNGDAARRDRDGIKSPATADAWFKQYPAMSASADCGWNIAFEIDWASFKDTPPHHVISDGWCEQLTRIVSDVCAEPHGKSVMKPITVVRCEKLEGKASGPNSTMFHADGTKHAFQLASGKLTIKFGDQIGTGFFHTGVIEAVFPSVRWHKEVGMNLPYVQKKLTDWTEVGRRPQARDR